MSNDSCLRTHSFILAVIIIIIIILFLDLWSIRRNDRKWTSRNRIADSHFVYDEHLRPAGKIVVC